MDLRSSSNFFLDLEVRALGPGLWLLYGFKSVVFSDSLVLNQKTFSKIDVYCIHFSCPSPESKEPVGNRLKLHVTISRNRDFQPLEVELCCQLCSWLLAILVLIGEA